MINGVWISADREEIAWREDAFLTVYNTFTCRESTPDRLEGEWIELPLPDSR
jgi:hypothetical protein